jgi:hypothetical protein
VTVAFGGSSPANQLSNSITGSIDRVTGDVEATSIAMIATKIVTSTSYSLKCRPTQRMF